MFSISRTVRARGARVVGSAALAAISMAALAACGSGGAADSSGNGTLVIQRSANSGFEPVLLAQEKGYFKAQGLNVEIKVASNDISKNIPLVVSGQVQLTEAGMSSLIAAKSQGLPLQAVLGVQNAGKGAKQDDGCLAPPGSSVTSLAGLEGRTVGVPTLGNPVQIINNIAMRNAGDDPAKVHYVALSTDALNAAATSGKVDAVCTFGLFYDEAVAAGFTPLQGGTVGTLPGAPQVIWIASNTFAGKNSAELTKFTAAMNQAYGYLNSHDAEYRAITAANTTLPKQYIETRPLPVMTAAISRSATEAIATEMQKDGFTKSTPSANDLVAQTIPDV
jgi:NitT/TauT family transport system substrate-binding protein